jgi:hypothetical protein
MPVSLEVGRDSKAKDTGEAVEAHSAASLEYIRVEENGQRNTVGVGWRLWWNPFTEAVHGFFTMDGATQKKFRDLVNLACKGGRVCVLVSIPFRDV